MKTLRESGLAALVDNIKRFFILKKDISYTPTEQEYERTKKVSVVKIGDEETDMLAPAIQRDYEENDETSDAYIKNRTHWKEILGSGEGVITERDRFSVSSVLESSIIYGVHDTISIKVGDSEYPWMFIIGPQFPIEEGLVTAQVAGSGTSYNMSFVLNSSNMSGLHWEPGMTYSWEIMRPHFISNKYTEQGLITLLDEGVECAKIFWSGQLISLLHNPNHTFVSYENSSDTSFELLPDWCVILPPTARMLNCSVIDYDHGDANGINVEVKERANRWYFVVTKPENDNIYIYADSEFGIEWIEPVSKMKDNRKYFVKVVGNSKYGYFGTYWQMGTE